MIRGKRRKIGKIMRGNSRNIIRKNSKNNKQDINRDH